MKLRLFLLVAAAVVAACSSTASQHTGTGATGTGGGDPCAGLGCASFPGTLTLHVVGPTSEPVADPVFQENGATISASCEDDAGVPIADAGACVDWVFDQLSEGPQTIVVSAPGFGSQSVGVTLQGPAVLLRSGPGGGSRR